MFWINNNPPQQDIHAAFRACFWLEQETDIELQTLGANWYVMWLDGEFLLEGPPRHPPSHPEYQVTRLRLAAGRHLLAAQVHEIGLLVERHPHTPPFLHLRAMAGGEEIALQWKCLQLPGYTSQVRRISPQHAWVEWCDTRQVPANWLQLEFDDAAWAAPVAVDPGLGEMQPLSTADTRQFVIELEPVAQGPLANAFGYVNEDISARFFLRDLVCDKLPAKGVWRRYDLGRVRLGRPRFIMDLPAGAIVEFAYCEALYHDRVHPWITLSGGYTCNMEYFEARGGVQEFFPLTPKGGRWMEIHVFAPDQLDSIKFIREEYWERGYFDAPDGAFICDDELLNRIWMVGVETLRGCAEDGMIDNPTRERGQWTGDVVAVGMDIGAAAWSDLRLLRRALFQSALCAREDGQIAGLCPGFIQYLAPYAVQWTNAVMHYYELTGERGFLEELFGYAQKNILAFENFVTDAGLDDLPRPGQLDLGWIFIDWGYVRNEGPSDMAMNLHFHSALQAMIRWCEVLGRDEEKRHYMDLAEKFDWIISQYLEEMMRGGDEGWPKIGYHRTVLALALGFFSGRRAVAAIDYIKRHMLDCFPNDPGAPRNDYPGAGCTRLITPYFAHYAFPPLIEKGEMNFVLDQYRKCWGWALEQNPGSWLEVFDTRWSYCHQWSGCPTWQLSRYVLGLHPRFDLGLYHFDFKFVSGSLNKAAGSIPVANTTRLVHVEWQRKEDGIHYLIRSPQKIWVHGLQGPEALEVEGEYRMLLQQ